MPEGNLATNNLLKSWFYYSKRNIKRKNFMEINLLKIGCKISFKGCKKVQYKTKNLHNWQRHTYAWKCHTKGGHANHARVGPRDAKVLLITTSWKSVSSTILLSVVQQVFVLLRKVLILQVQQHGIMLPTRGK